MKAASELHCSVLSAAGLQSHRDFETIELCLENNRDRCDYALLDVQLLIGFFPQ